MPHSGPKLSLNGVRVFEAAARLRSLKAAAAELGVTQSAVSHQVRQLETNVGVRLFLRRHDGVDLTADGARLFERVAVAINAISRAPDEIRTDAHAVSLRVSASLAYRWLLPRLDLFRREFPRISVRLDTSRPPNGLEPGVDIAIRYARRGAAGPNATHLLPDRACPVISPALAATSRRLRRKLRLESLPLLSAAEDDWDWRAWARHQGVPFQRLSFAYRFDIDHAALEACVRGVGVALATKALVGEELRSGALVPLEDTAAAHLGDYWMQTAKPCRAAVQKVVTWLQAQN